MIYILIIVFSIPGGFSTGPYTPEHSYQPYSIEFNTQQACLNAAKAIANPKMNTICVEKGTQK